MSSHTNPAEEAFTKAFIRSEKRARFLQFLSDPKHRREQLDRLGRDLPCMPGFTTPVPGHQDFPGELEKLLTARGAGPTCHVIAAGLRSDGRQLPLREALNQVCMSEFGALLLCLPERLAYYKPESPGAGLLLERHLPTTP